MPTIQEEPQIDEAPFAGNDCIRVRGEASQERLNESNGWILLHKQSKDDKEASTS